MPTRLPQDSPTALRAGIAPEAWRLRLAAPTRGGSTHDTRSRVVLACVALLLAIGSAVSSPTPASAADPVASTGPGEGRLTQLPDDRSCNESFFHADGSYENGYAWQYGGVVAPYWGAFAECYTSTLPICGAAFDLTQTGNQAFFTMDVYAWDDAGGVPGAIRCLDPGVSPGAIAFWPSVSRHVVELPGCATDSDLWVGYWGDWPNQFAGWYVGADLDGPGGGCPMTNVAPGIGYPTGWQDVSVVWGPTASIGIGVVYDGATIEGACCYETGVCIFQPLSECQGQFQGQGVSCDPNPCPQPGACCFDDGSCLVLMEDDCYPEGIAWAEGDCDPNPCDQLTACCFELGECVLLVPDLCAQAGGASLPDEPTCDPNPCPQPEPGACCYPGGTCLFVTILECDGGMFLGEGTSCDPNPCAVPGLGACCYGDGGCRIRTQDSCEGTFQGAGTSCQPNPCPSPAEGACCFEDGTCQFLSAVACANAEGRFEGEGTGCEPNPCPSSALGACCLIDGSCLIVDAIECAAADADFLGEGVSCTPNPCPQPLPGACCLALGECVFTTDLLCLADGGEFQGYDTVCEPNPCPQPCVPFALAGRPSTELPPPPVDPFAGANRAARGGSGPNLGGTLVLHANPGVVYTSDGIYCGLSGVDRCGDVNNRTDVEDTAVVHALALFPASSSPRLKGLVFGIDFPDCVQVLDWHACGDFEIADGGWPGPGTGTAITWSETQTDRVVEIYWFAASGLAAEPGELALTPHPTQGALFADDSVPAVLDDIVALGSFGFFRDGATPCPGVVDPLGACCFGDGTCMLLSLAACVAGDGSYLGIDTPCEPNPCVPGEIGACCLYSDGSCVMLNESACALAGGEYQGAGVSCAPNPCDAVVTGACCLVDGSCVVASAADCTANDGLYRGNDTDCDPDPCPPAGACCFENGLCAELFASHCQSAGGVFLGDEIPCEEDMCPAPGACCFPDGSCVELQELVCEGDGGAYQGDDVPCEPELCPQPPNGACCFPNGDCLFIDSYECEDLGGVYLGDGAPCGPMPCPQPPEGACCLRSGECHILDAFDCEDARGTYLGDGVTCDPNPCPPPQFGACCLEGGECQDLFSYECDDLGGSFQGEGILCADTHCGIPCPPPLVPSYSPPEPGRGPHAGGTLIVHANLSVQFTVGGDYCGILDIETCESAVTRFDPPFEHLVFQVLAAFPANASPRLAGVTLGISYAECLILEDWGHCGDFELHTSDWPASGEGTAVTWGAAQQSHLVEIFWFGGYVDSFDPTTFDLIPHPTGGSFFADDDVPSNLDPVAGFGSLGFRTPGHLPCPSSAAPGACCFPDGSCAVLFEDECTSSGGHFQGEGTLCDPNPCSAPPTGACCFDDFSCQELSAADCASAGGYYVGDGVPCEPGLCIPVPTVEESWGLIKERFRTGR